MDLRRLFSVCLWSATALAAGGCAGLNGGSSSLDNLVDERPPRPFPTATHEPAVAANSRTTAAQTVKKQTVAKPAEKTVASTSTKSPADNPAKIAAEAPVSDAETNPALTPLPANETPTLQDLASGRPRADQMKNLPADRVAIRTGPQPTQTPPPNANVLTENTQYQPPPNSAAAMTDQESAEAAYAAQQILARLANTKPQAGMDYSTVMQAQMQQILNQMQLENGAYALPYAPPQSQNPQLAAGAPAVGFPVGVPAGMPPAAPPAVVQPPGTVVQAAHNSNVPPAAPPPPPKPPTAEELLQKAEVVRAEWIDTLEGILATGNSQLSAEQKQRLEQELRLAYLAAGRVDEATEPIPQAQQVDAESFKHLMFAIHHLLPEEAERRSSHRYALSLRSLREAEKELCVASRLDLKNLTFCDSVQQYGWYNEFKKREFAAGQQVILYLEVDNATAEKKSADQYETELQGSYQIFNTANELVGERTLPLDKEICRNWRRDYFLAYRIYLPDDLAAGSYRLELRLEDLKARPPAGGKKFGEGLIDFTVR